MTDYSLWVNSTWDKIDKKMQKVSVRSRNKIPYTTDENNVHIDKSKEYIGWWTNGFWGALNWLLYADTKNEVYRDTALSAEKIMDAGFHSIERLHHDVGFMWHISSGVNWRLNQDEESKKRALYAAYILASRFNVRGDYITCWPGKEKQGWTIIDSMMNIPLLYWASDYIGDDRFRAIAIKHANTVMRDHIRDDGSVVHIVVHDVESDKVLETLRGQGYEVGSTWSRGAAWALYGFVLSYIHTGNVDFLNTAKKVAHYFISCVSSSGYLAKVDFRQPAEPLLYDSTAGCCAACGLLELAKCVGDNEKEIYLKPAYEILRATDEKFCNYDDECDYLVGFGTDRYPHIPENSLVHKPIIYGDFFFVEALYKLRGNELLFW